jgi:hypothetical protein
MTSNTQGNVLTAVTDEGGRFVFPIVRPDTYSLRVTLQGFKSLERTTVVVNANDRLALGVLALEVGALTEEVSVTSRVTEVQSTSGERSFTLEAEALKNMGSNGRMLFNLATLAPGVLSQNTGGQELNQVSNFTVDAGDLVVMPGLVDTHVHVNEPGRTDWEGFETATRAAAAGGVTTLLDMPLNSIPATTTVAALHEKARAARGKTWVDVGFIGGVVPGNAPALGALARGGVRAFKCFLVPSGVREFQHVTQPDLREAMPVLAELDATLMVHAELPAVVEAATLEAAAGDPVQYTTYLASRPPAAEHEAVALVIELAALTGARVHIVHVSSAQTARMGNPGGRSARGARRGARRGGATPSG